MPNEASVTLWINAVRQGDVVAAEKLWQRYFSQLMSQARQRMSNLNRGTYDEEDAALSTFQIVFAKLQSGHYANLSDRNELWQLMLTILVRKISRRFKYQQALKRRSAQDHTPSSIIEAWPDGAEQQISSEFYDLIASLGDPHLEKVALLRFEGYTNDEIAIQLNRTRRTIQRMLNLIRTLWLEKLDRE